MAISVQITRVRKVPETGRIYITFADGAELEFSSAQAIVEWAKDADTAAQPGVREWLRRAGIQFYLYRDPNMTNPGVVVGKTMTLDLSVANPITVI